MKRRNDYCNLVRTHLSNYKQYEAVIKNLEEEVSVQEEKLKVSAPIARYSDEPRGGSQTSSVVENIEEQHRFIYERIEVMKNDINNIKKLLGKIRNGLDSLTEYEKFIIVEHYINGTEWGYIAFKEKMSESSVRQKASRAVKKITYTMVGSACNGEKSNFIFAV